MDSIGELIERLFPLPMPLTAIARQDLDIVSVERHNTRGKDFRVFIVARKPA